MKNGIIGIGNALVDIMTNLSDEEVLNDLNFPKGSMQLVDLEVSEKVQKMTSDCPTKLTSGGSTANSIHGIAQLGGKSAYIGVIGDDDYGNFFKKDLIENNIETFLFNGEQATGRAVAMITPDSERTFATHLGAAVEINEKHITPKLFDDYGIMLLEGYLIFNQGLAEHAAKIAKEQGLKVAIDLASFNVVEENLEFLQRIVKEYVDIVFANEEEAKAFTSQEPEDAVNTIAEVCDIAVVKVGKDGSIIKQGDKTYRVGAKKANCIDTTGAGDLYAAGFLWGYTNDKPLDKCGAIGAKLAENVIEVIGAKIPKERWRDIIINI